LKIEEHEKNFKIKLL